MHVCLPVCPIVISSSAMHLLFLNNYVLIDSDILCGQLFLACAAIFGDEELPYYRWRADTMLYNGAAGLTLSVFFAAIVVHVVAWRPRGLLVWDTTTTTMAWRLVIPHTTTTRAAACTTTHAWKEAGAEHQKIVVDDDDEDDMASKLNVMLCCTHVHVVAILYAACDTCTG